MSAYVRPASIDEALALLDAAGAQPLAGGTDLVPLQSRGKAAGALVDVRALLGDAIEAHGDGLVIGAATRVADVAGDARVAERYAALSQAAGAAASPQLRNQGTVGGQPGTARALLVLPASRPDLLAGRRRHLLRADRRPPQARPRGRRLHLGRALGPRRRAAGARREGRITGAAASGACRSPSSTGARAPDHRSALQLARGELITAVELPAPPDASAYERAGERAAWSFALVGIAAARFGDTLRLAAIGLTNEPRLLDPADPLRGLDGLEQTGWKRELSGVLCERALARVASR